MQLFYNSVGLHTIGVLRIAQQGFEPLPNADSPHRKRASLRITIDVFEQSYLANRNQLAVVRDALNTQHATLLWKDESTGTEYLNQTATVASHDFPEDPNADMLHGGTTHQRINVTFQYFEQNLVTNTPVATFRKSGSVSAALQLGNVFTQRRTYAASRYSTLRSQRSAASGRIALTGTFLGDTLASLADRRATLGALVTLWETEVNGKDGTLTYLDFNKVARIEEFDAQVNDASSAIDWTLSASYTNFPNETGYALAEYEISTNENRADGSVTLTMAGRIGAQSAVAAAAKLAALRVSLAAAQTTLGNSIHLVNTRSSEQNVAADTDGDAFLEIRFEDEYKISKTATVADWTLRLSDTEDPHTGMIRRVYSGSVLARSTSWDAAYQAAHTKARALGADKHRMLVIGAISVIDHQQSADAVTTGTDRFALIEFSFEYQIKGTRVYVEVTADTASDTFGADIESVSGFIAASDFATCVIHYDTIKAAYAAQMIRNERTARTTQKMSLVAPTGTNRTPPNSGAWGTAVNTGETTDATYALHPSRFEFSFQVHKEKTTGAGIAVRYSIRVRTDYTNRTVATQLAGSVFANSRADADFAIAQITADGYGNLLDSERSEDRDWFLGVRTSSADDRPATGQGYFIKLDFSESFNAHLASEDTILECEVSEEIEFSGPRKVVQATAFGRDVVQTCGTGSGRRTVTGRVKAASEAAAMAWVRRQYFYPFGSVSGLPDEPATRHRVPPRISLQPAFVLLDDGIARSDVDADYNPTAAAVNVAAWQAGFTFSEILTDYDWL